MSDFFSSSAHYYSIDGNTVSAAYDADLREARKRRLYVSPTTVAKVRYSWGLENWKQGMLVESVLSHPQEPNEDIDLYKKRIAEVANKPAKKAQNFGTDLHDALENFPQLPLDPTLHPWIDQYAPWHTENVAETLASEIMLAHHGIGIAGKADKVFILKDGRIGLADYKTTEFKPDKTDKKMFYDSWAIQLAFYSRAYQLREGLPTMPACVSIAINSKNPEPPKVREWTPQEIELAWGEFLCQAWMWSKEKNYWPVGQWSPVEFWAL